MSSTTRKVGLLINPKSGYGISLNLPGSDNIEEYNPEKSHSVKIAEKFLKQCVNKNINFITAGSYMGEETLRKSGIESYEVIYEPGKIPSREDTIHFLDKLNNSHPDILLYFGGDGTSADISSALDSEIPVIGIPAGVKMHSSVFSITPEHGLRLFMDWLSGTMEYENCDVVDIDEQLLVNGEISYSVKGALKVPVSVHMLLSSKREYSSTDVMGAVEYILENMEKDVNYFIGSGSTCKYITSELGFKTPFYGIDIIRNRKLLKENADRNILLKESSIRRSVLILTPIGGQGYVVGRGNRQIDKSVLNNISFFDIIIIASSEKLNDLDFIVMDSSPYDQNWIRVIYDYGRFKLMKVVS